MDGDLKVDGRKVNFKINTGAGVIVIPDHVFDQIYNSDTSKLIKAKKTYSTPNVLHWML